jgi:hypothetical protein
MPYIAKELRDKYRNVLRNLPDIETKGDLEYCVYWLLKKYMVNRPFKYTELHEAVYGVIHAGEEFKRQNLDKREDQAKEMNGDIEL